MSDRSGGFTLVEMVVAIVVLGLGLAGLLVSINTTARSTADPMVRKQMLSLAEGMLEEVLLKQYTTGAGTIAAGSCNRESADDIRDYQGYGVADGCGQPRDLSGALIPNLTQYAVTVSIDTGASLGALTADVAKITVAVTHGAESLSLAAYRTHYAKVAP